mmetsp:Transcript_14054/g.21029  ORF Transcript_14054/g.21029 Transcript_14054/m.21029 type:complete len:205 (+) Transcript_14054:96-710(+)
MPMDVQLLFPFIHSSNQSINSIHLSICIGNSIQMKINLLLFQNRKCPIRPLHHGNLNLTSSKITPQNTSQAHDGSPNRLINIIILHILHLLLQEINRLLLLRPTRRTKKRQIMPRTINFQNLRSLFIIHPNQNTNGGKGTHTRRLSINLCNIGNSLCKDVYGNRVSVLVLKISRFVPHALDLCFAVCNHSSGETTDFGCDLENV